MYHSIFDDVLHLNGDSIMNRQAANLKLLEILRAEIEKYPDHRFSQILRNCSFVFSSSMYIERADENFYYWENEFNLEPESLLERVKCEMKRLRLSSEEGGLDDDSEKEG